MIEDDYVHVYTRKNREAIYAFFQKALNLPGDSIDENVEILKPEELNATSTGHLSTSLGCEIVFSLNKKETQKLIEKIEESRKNIQEHLNYVKQKAKELSGYATPYGEDKPVFRGRYQREVYSIEMFALQGEGDYIVPLLIFFPKETGKFPAIIYIHPEGKAYDASPGGEIEQLVKKGFIVAVPDVIGTGETKDKPDRLYRTYHAQVIVGKSVVGIQAGDIIRVVNFLKNRSDVNFGKIGAIAFDEMCPTLLHAAAFDKSISSVILIGSPISYKSIVMNKFYEVSSSCVVPGALTAYDLPDLVGCIAPGKLLLAELKDQMKKPASKELIDKELEFPRLVYSKILPENLKVLSSYESLNSIVDWCFE